ncbi:MAG: methionyl-tRNA formyltransferase [Candidatus Gorgyraea atricola]|nr:methionyl-tRNA formyltransferase [Candidatus Gorgyraea atricola]
MKIVFFGSSEFAVPVLEGLDVALVVTQPDRKKGRSQKISSTAVKIKADELKIKTFQSEDVNSKESIEYLKGLGADLFIVVSFGQILSRELLDVPKLYALNVHASLLPKYRGAAPINWAIANAEKETGITIIKMNEKMDEGDIVLKEAVSINKDEDATQLSKKLSKKGAEVLLKCLGSSIDFEKQDSSKATYAPKLKKEDGLIDWNWSAEKIYNRIRAFVPWPGCFTHLDKKILKIYKASVRSESSDKKPGTILEITKEYISVGTGKGILNIKELQLESKRRMNVEEFIAGHKELTIGAIFSLCR